MMKRGYTAPRKIWSATLMGFIVLCLHHHGCIWEVQGWTGISSLTHQSKVGNDSVYLPWASTRHFARSKSTTSLQMAGSSSSSSSRKNNDNKAQRNSSKTPAAKKSKPSTTSSSSSTFKDTRKGTSKESVPKMTKSSSSKTDPSTSNTRHRSYYFTSQKKVDQQIQELRRKDRNDEELTQSYFDSVLGVCVAYDEWESVLEVLDIMKRRGYTQERSSYRACLQACFEAGNGASAREILQAMDKARVQPEPWDIGLTVAAMCRQDMSAGSAGNEVSNTQKDSENNHAAWWHRALSMLKSTAANPELVTDPSNVIPVQAYNIILERMVEEKQWKEAVRLLRLMENNSGDNNNNNNVSNHKERPKGGYHPLPEVSTYRRVIECCVATNQAEQAAQVLYSMKDRGVQATTYACELVISALSKKLQWRRALQLLDLMDEMNIPKTVVTYNSVISACARAREVGMAKSLLAKMQRVGIRPDEVSFNSVIGACASTARWKDALALLDQCYREPGVTPNIYIYTNAMRACAKGGNTKRALNLLQVVKDKGLPLDTYCYTAVIDACAKSKMWKKALALLDEMQQQGIEPSEVTYSVTISACGNGGQWQKALDLLKMMKTKGMSANVITYNAALTALSKASRQKARHMSKITIDDVQASKRPRQEESIEEEFGDHGEGLWSKALELVAEMKADGIEPDGFCYSSAMSCCGAEGRWEEALELMDTMKQGGPRTRPNRIAYTAAISACGRAGQAQHALDLFQAMKNEGLSADRVAYNALFSALRVASDAEQSFRLWGEICGTRSTATSTAIATAKDIASPDIITVTDCIATLSRADRVFEMDQVFEEAVSRGIVLRNNGLDLQWETDLSGMSLPVARAAVRYILRQLAFEHNTNEFQDLTFITGVGRAQQRRKEDGASTQGPDNEHKNPTTSLRDYVQEVLESEFQPTIRSTIPPRAQGTLEIRKDVLQKWAEQQLPQK